MKNETILFLCALFILPVKGTPCSSLYFNKIYEASSGKPITSGSVWKAFAINGEKTKISFTGEDMLSVHTEEKGTFVYMAPMENVGISALPCHIETAVGMTGDKAGMDMDIRTSEGKRLSVHIGKAGLVDRIKNDKISFEPGQDLVSVFRFSFDNKNRANLYRNGRLLLTTDCISGDEINNTGFEEAGPIDPMWWCSDWSQLTIDGTHPHNGAKSLHWENGWTGQLGASIPVQPNAKYRLTYWARAVRINAGQPVMKGALWINGENKGSLDIPVGDYRKFSIEFSTANFDEVAEIIFHNGWNDSDAGAFAVYIDDLELTRLESPAYIQFGKTDGSGESEFLLSYIAIGPGDDKVPVRYTDLTEKISQAHALKSNAVPGTETGNYPQYAVDRLTGTLASADTLTENSAYPLLDASYALLEREINRFTRCRITDPDLKFARLDITPAVTELKLTGQIELTASGIMSDGRTIDPEILYMTYSSVNGKVSVDQTGRVKAIDTGTDEILITAQYINAVKTLRLPIEVKPYEIIRVEASPYREVVRLGDATGIHATAWMTSDEKGDNSRIDFSFQSLSPEIAEITGFGTIIGKAPGTAEIRVTGRFGDKDASAVFPIRVITADRIEIEMPAEIKAGETGMYTIKAYYTDGSPASPEEEDIIAFSKSRNLLQLNDQGLLVAAQKGEAVVSVRFRQDKTEIIRSETVEIGTSQSLSEQNSDPALRLYPNPASDKIFIDYPDGKDLSEVYITSLTGKIVSRRLLSSSNREMLNLSHLTPGVYFLSLTGKQTKIVRKLIKQ